MLVPAINSVIKMIMALDAVASLVRPRPSHDCADERAFHLLLNALHGAVAYANLAGDLDDAHTGPQTILDALFKRGIDPNLPSCLPCATARLRPAWTR